jgi:O-methyltransferase
MSSRTFQLSDAVHAYLVRETMKESPLLARLRAETAALPGAGMQISPEQGQFMRLLIELIGARRAIEIGVFTGYSALCVAEALPADGRLVACDVSEEWTAIARRYWSEAGVARKIDLRLGDAVGTLNELIGEVGEGRFDFSFIDADKTAYERYYELSLRLVRPGALIAIDNALWSGRVADRSSQDADTVALRELNAKICGDQRVTSSLVPIGDGLLLARKR